MKKTLLILSVVSGCYAAASADTLTGNTQLTAKAHTKYANGLNLGGYTLSQPTNNVWTNLEVNGLEGTGTISINRADGGNKPSNADVLWLYGDCSNFSGTVKIKDQNELGTSIMMLGKAENNAVADVSLANANVELSISDKSGAAGTLLALLGNATVATAADKTFSMTKGEIRHIKSDASVTGAVSTGSFSTNATFSAVTNNAVTLTLGRAALNGVTVSKGVKLLLTDHSTLSGTFTLAGDIAMNGNEKVFTISGNINENTSPSVRGNMSSDGATTTVSSGANVFVNALTLTSGAMVMLEDSAAFTFRFGGYSDYNGVEVRSLNAEQNATISGSGESGAFAGNTNDGNYTVSNAAITLLNIGGGYKTSAATYENVSVTTNGGDADFTFTNSASTFVVLNAKKKGITLADAQNTASTLKEVTANEGDVTIKHLGEGTALDSLTLNANRTTSFYSSTDTSVEATISVTKQLTVNGDSNLNANLVMTEGTMSFAHDAQLTMGCSVTIGEEVKVVLTDADIAMIQAGQTVDLILSAEQITLGNGVSELSNIYRQDSEGNLIKMSDDFKIVADSDNNKVYAMPEPATATLSLLALAGLCVRRRRK